MLTPPAPESVLPLIRLALAEDIGGGDITSERLIPAALTGTLAFVAREPMVAAGGFLLPLVFAELDARVRVTLQAADGVALSAGGIIAEASGPARSLLSGERVALNLLQRLCGVATLTRQYVDAVAGTSAKILDTRKTLPGFRALDKYAVACGGGINHRFGLYDAVLIKDNHIALVGGVAAAVEKGRCGDGGMWGYGGNEKNETFFSSHPHISTSPHLPLILECDTLAQLAEALALPSPPDRILLDNMTPAQLRQAVTLTAGRLPLEASGGVNLQTVRAIAETGVDFISIGALTHSARAADIGGDIVLG